MGFNTLFIHINYKHTQYTTVHQSEQKSDGQNYGFHLSFYRGNLALHI